MNTHRKAVGSCNRYKRGICVKEEKGIFVIKRREGGDV